MTACVSVTICSDDRIEESESFTISLTLGEMPTTQDPAQVVYLTPIETTTITIGDTSGIMPLKLNRDFY